MLRADVGPLVILDDTVDGGGIWVGSSEGPIEFAADPQRWRQIACDIVNRELTDDEWRTFVSETDSPTSACA